MASSGESLDTCAVCQDAFTEPKFLPCHHTFCATCITGLASHPYKNIFLCPICRARTSLPSRGVSALQTNFYIQDRGPHQRCGVHKKKELEIYCLECQKAICVTCLTEHAEHKVQPIESVVEEEKEELFAGKARLQEELVNDQHQLSKTEAEKTDVLKEIAGIKIRIRNRHAALVAVADTYRDEALESLQIVSNRLERDIAKTQKQCEDKLKHTTHLLQKMTDIKTRTGTAETLALIRKVQHECTILERPRTTPSQKMGIKFVKYPALMSNETVLTNAAVQKMARDFVGTITVYNCCK